MRAFPRWQDHPPAEVARDARNPPGPHRRHFTSCLFTIALFYKDQMGNDLLYRRLERLGVGGPAPSDLTQQVLPRWTAQIQAGQALMKEGNILGACKAYQATLVTFCPQHCDYYLPTPWNPLPEGLAAAYIDTLVVRWREAGLAQLATAPPEYSLLEGQGVLDPGTASGSRSLGHADAARAIGTAQQALAAAASSALQAGDAGYVVTPVRTTPSSEAALRPAKFLLPAQLPSHLRVVPAKPTLPTDRVSQLVRWRMLLVTSGKLASALLHLHRYGAALHYALLSSHAHALPTDPLTPQLAYAAANRANSAFRLVLQIWKYLIPPWRCVTFLQAHRAGAARGTPALTHRLKVVPSALQILAATAVAQTAPYFAYLARSAERWHDRARAPDPGTKPESKPDSPNPEPKPADNTTQSTGAEAETVKLAGDADSTDAPAKPAEGGGDKPASVDDGGGDGETGDEKGGPGPAVLEAGLSAKAGLPSLTLLAQQQGLDEVQYSRASQAVRALSERFNPFLWEGRGIAMLVRSWLGIAVTLAQAVNCLGPLAADPTEAAQWADHLQAADGFEPVAADPSQAKPRAKHPLVPLALPRWLQDPLPGVVLSLDPITFLAPAVAGLLLPKAGAKAGTPVGPAPAKAGGLFRPDLLPPPPAWWGTVLRVISPRMRQAIVTAKAAPPRALPKFVAADLEQIQPRPITIDPEQLYREGARMHAHLLATRRAGGTEPAAGDAGARAGSDARPLDFVLPILPTGDPSRPQSAKDANYLPFRATNIAFEYAVDYPALEGAMEPLRAAVNRLAQAQVHSLPVLVLQPGTPPQVFGPAPCLLGLAAHPSSAPASGPASAPDPAAAAADLLPETLRKAHQNVVTVASRALAVDPVAAEALYALGLSQLCLGEAQAARWTLARLHWLQPTYFLLHRLWFLAREVAAGRLSHRSVLLLMEAINWTERVSTVSTAQRRLAEARKARASPDSAGRQLPPELPPQLVAARAREWFSAVLDLATELGTAQAEAPCPAGEGGDRADEGAQAAQAASPTAADDTPTTAALRGVTQCPLVMLPLARLALVILSDPDCGLPERVSFAVARVFLSYAQQALVRSGVSPRAPARRALLNLLLSGVVTWQRAAGPSDRDPATASSSATDVAGLGKLVEWPQDLPVQSVTSYAVPSQALLPPRSLARVPLAVPRLDRDQDQWIRAALGQTIRAELAHEEWQLLISTPEVLAQAREPDHAAFESGTAARDPTGSGAPPPITLKTLRAVLARSRASTIPKAIRTLARHVCEAPGIVLESDPERIYALMLHPDANPLPLAMARYHRALLSGFVPSD